MKRNLSQEIPLPENVEVKIEGDLFIVKGPLGELKKEFDLGKVEVKQTKENITFFNKKSTKTEKRIMNTSSAHLRNMIKGVQELFEYKLKLCFGHFPFTLKIEGKKAIIKNFLGEKIQRETTIPEGVEVEMNKEIIIIKSMDREKAGQAAANLERITRIKGRDKRIFQDGIYILEKCGRTF